MAHQYRKKPIVIEAIQWTGDNLEELREWGALVTPDYYKLRGVRFKYGLWLQKRNGNQSMLQVGDWVIKGIKGEFYPCEDEMFKLYFDHLDGLSQPAQNG